MDTATSSLYSSGDEDPWGQVLTVPTACLGHYTQFHTLDIKLLGTFTRPPCTVRSISMKPSRLSYVELVVPTPDAEIEITDDGDQKKSSELRGDIGAVK